MCRAIEMSLDNHGMGIKKISDLDLLVAMDDEILVSRYAAKDARSIRLEKTKNKKNRRQKMAKYAYQLIMPNSGKVKDTGWRSYEKGDKVYRRHHNYDIVFNPADPYGDTKEFEDFELEKEYIRFLRSFIHNVEEEEAEETLETTMRLKMINYNAKRDYPLYYQMPITFNKISSYLRGTEKLDKLEEKREELLRKLEELDMDMAHIRGCLKDIF